MTFENSSELSWANVYTSLSPFPSTKKTSLWQIFTPLSIPMHWCHLSRQFLPKKVTLAKFYTYIYSYASVSPMTPIFAKKSHFRKILHLHHYLCIGITFPAIFCQKKSIWQNLTPSSIAMHRCHLWRQCLPRNRHWGKILHLLLYLYIDVTFPANFF